MDKTEAAMILDNELLELSIVLGKAKAAGEATKEYFFDEMQIPLIQEKRGNANYLNEIMLECLNEACILIERIGE